MQVEIKGNQLVITLPLNPDPTPSKSLKNLVVATTHGIVTTAAVINGKPVKLGVNAFIGV